MNKYAKKYIVLFSSICFLYSFVLTGCTKQTAEYEPNTKFAYNDVQEGKKELAEDAELLEQSLAEDSLGQDMQGDGIQEFDLEGGGVAIIQQSETPMPELPDMPLEDLQNLASSDNAETESPTSEAPSSQTPDTQEQQADAPVTEAPGETTPEEPTIPDSETQTVTPDDPATEVTDTPEEAPTTEATGEEAGSGDGTQETPPTDNTDNSTGGDGSNPGDTGSNPDMPGDSTPSDAGTGEAGTGDEGNSDSGGGDAGGTQSGDNGAGAGDSGDGGNGAGGETGDGGDGGIGGDEPTDPGIGGNPDEVVRVWYEGTLGNYIWGETPDTSGLTVYAEFGDGTEKEVDAYNINMNYPERYVADITQKIPKTYDPGVYYATISYQNAQVECPYNLTLLFATIVDYYYGNCKDPIGHNAHSEALLPKYPEIGTHNICDRGCFYRYTTDDGKPAFTVGIGEMIYVPVYCDYTYTIEDFMSDNYFVNVKYNLDDYIICGTSSTIYKNSIVSYGYYSYALTRDIYMVSEDLERLNEFSQEHH